MKKTFLRQAALAAMLATTALAPAVSAHAEAAAKGGNIIVTFKDDIATLDPAIGYDWQNWSMINAMFSRLVDYTPGTTELKLHAARHSLPGVRMLTTDPNLRSRQRCGKSFEPRSGLGRVPATLLLHGLSPQLP